MYCSSLGAASICHHGLENNLTCENISILICTSSIGFGHNKWRGILIVHVPWQTVMFYSHQRHIRCTSRQQDTETCVSLGSVDFSPFLFSGSGSNSSSNRRLKELIFSLNNFLNPAQMGMFPVVFSIWKDFKISDTWCLKVYNEFKEP